jgi:hypothetical protein
MSCSNGSCNCGQQLTDLRDQVSGIEEHLKDADRRFDKFERMIKKLLSLQGEDWNDDPSPRSTRPYGTAESAPAMSADERVAAEEGGDHQGGNIQSSTTSSSGRPTTTSGGDAAHR